MSVELNSASSSPKALAKSDVNSKMSGKANANVAGGNFALMLNTLSASDTALADTDLTDVDLKAPSMGEGVMPLTMLMTQLSNDNSTATPGQCLGLGSVDLGVQVGAGQVVASASDLSKGVSMRAMPLPVGGAVQSSLLPKSDPTAVATSGLPGDLSGKIDPQRGANFDVTSQDLQGRGADALPSAAPVAIQEAAPVGVVPLVRDGWSGSAQTPDVNIEPVGVTLPTVEVKTAWPSAPVRQEPKDFRVPMAVRADVVPTAITSPDIGRIGGDWMAMLPSQATALSKPSGGLSSVGLDGSFGVTGAFSSYDNGVYEVTQATAVVPEPALAETVSYWVSHGVQTAELTLEGFGDDPVEVSIMLNGDQAQIDFRTDQEEVRQALENASDQLKEMLSGEGVQLTGVSVGSSGKGGSGGGTRQEHSTVQKFMRADATPTTPVVTRSANPSVGRSLDLFV